MQWSIQRKTQLGFSVALAVLIAVIAVTYFSTESFLSSADDLQRSLQQNAAQERIYSALVEALSSQLNYSASGSPADLEARNAALTRLSNQNADLRATAATAPPEQRRAIAALETTIKAEADLLDEALRSRTAQTNTAETLAKRRIRATQLLSAVRARLDALAQQQNNRIATQIAGNHKTALWLYGLMALVCVLFVFGLRWLLMHILLDLKARDVVDRNLAQANLFLESLIENIPTMIFVKDAKELRFIRFNRAGEQLLGYGREELIGKNDNDLFPSEQAAFFIGKDREVLAASRVFDIPSEEIDTRHQGQRILHTRKVPVLDASGTATLLLGISMDITEQKLSEREVLKLNSELKQKADQLTLANQELESFCYSVSHDLRAPLRAIDGYSGILQQNYGEQLDREAHRLLHNVRKNIQRMAELIDDLLEFSRVSRQPLELTLVDMTELAQRAAAEAIGYTDTTRPDISIQPLIDAHCDARALYHVWLNLLDNAIKYSSQSSAPKITAWAEHSGAEIIYSVRDNGIGFDMQFYDKLFGVFERLHSSKEYPGTGVGLAIVQRVIARHGGRVWAESTPGLGATFHFSLPQVA